MTFCWKSSRCLKCHGRKPSKPFVPIADSSLANPLVLKLGIQHTPGDTHVIQGFTVMETLRGTQNMYYSALKLVYLRKPPFCHFFPIFPFTLSFSHNSKGSPISHHPKSLYGSLLCNLKYLLIFAERKKKWKRHYRRDI